jgi:hypothetical protein
MAMSGGGTQQMASCIFAKNVFFLCRSAHISAITNLIDGRLARVDVLGNNTGIRTASNSIPPPPSLIDIVAKSDRMASTFNGRFCQEWSDHQDDFFPGARKAANKEEIRTIVADRTDHLDMGQMAGIVEDAK